MQGTEKQINWAVRIQETKLAELDLAIEKLETRLAKTPTNSKIIAKINGYRLLRKNIGDITNAQSLIAIRDWAVGDIHWGSEEQRRFEADCFR